MSATTSPSATAAAPPGERLSFREKVGYGLGDTASNLYFQTFTNFLLYFYTDVFGIAAGAAGTMLLVVRIWDTFLDPVVGVIADRTNTRWGHYRPWLLWVAFPIAVLGVVMFTTPNFGPTGKLVYAYVTYSLMMMAYSFINIPYSALMGVITSRSDERTVVASYRFVLSFAGLFAVQLSTLKLSRLLGGGDPQKGFQLVMVIFGIAAIALFLVTFATTRERVQPAAGATSTLRSDLKDLLENKPWLIISGVGVFALCYISVRMGAIVYYFKYCVGDEQLAAWFMGTGTVGAISGTMLAGPIARLLGGKRRAYLILMAVASALTIGFYLVPMGSLPLVFTLHFLISSLFAPTSPLLWSFYADTADYSEWRTGRRATGLVFSAASFSQKLGWSVGSALSAWMLGLFGYQANVAQTADSQTGIRLLMSVVPGVLGLLSAAAIFFYTLDDPTMEKIGRELEERKQTAAS